MPVRIRLARQGTRNNPFYHVVAIADHKPRDARPIEKLGEYDPIPRLLPFISPRMSPDLPVLSSGLPAAVAKTSAASSSSSSPSASASALAATSPIDQSRQKRLEWNSERIKYWLSVGAQPSKPVARMLDKAGLIPAGKVFKGMQLHSIKALVTAEEVAKKRKARISRGQQPIGLVPPRSRDALATKETPKESSGLATKSMTAAAGMEVAGRVKAGNTSQENHLADQETPDDAI